MGRIMYNSFDTIEAYRFSFGQYKGKSLEDIKDKDDAVEYLKRYRKKLKKELRNPKAKKYAPYNKRGLKEIEEYLISIGENIELTNIDELENENNTTPKIEETSFSYEDLDFKSLIQIFEEKILDRYDEKFQSKKFIRNEYKDYLCLRYGNLTYIELLENQNKDILIQIIQKI